MPPKYSHVTPREELAMPSSLHETEETPLLEQTTAFRPFASERNRGLPSQHGQLHHELHSLLDENAHLEPESKESPYHYSTHPTVMSSNALSNLAGLERTMESSEKGDSNNTHNRMSDYNKTNNNNNNNKSVSSILSSRGKLTASHPSVDASAKEKTITSHEFSQLHPQEGTSTTMTGSAEHYRTKANNRRRVIHATLAPRLVGSEETLISKDATRHSVAQHTNTPFARETEESTNIENSNSAEKRNTNSETTNSKQVAQISNALLSAASTQNVNESKHHRVLEVVETSHEPNHSRRHHRNRHTRSSAQESDRLHHEQPHHTHNLETHHETLVSKENHFVNPVLLLTTGAELDNISWADNSIANEARATGHNTRSSNNNTNNKKNNSKETQSPHTTNTEHKNVPMYSSSSVAHLSPLSRHHANQQELTEHHHFHDDHIDRSGNSNNNKLEKHTSFLIATDEAVHATYKSDNTEETKRSMSSSPHSLLHLHDNSEVHNPLTPTTLTQEQEVGKDNARANIHNNMNTRSATTLHESESLHKWPIQGSMINKNSVQSPTFPLFTRFNSNNHTSPRSIRTSLPEIPLQASSTHNTLSSRVLHSAEEEQQHPLLTSSSLSSHLSEHNKQPE